MKRVIIILTAFIISPLCACAQKTGANIYRTGDNTYLTVNSYVRDIVNHPAFTGFSERLLARDNNSAYYDTPISNAASLMPYHQNINPAVIVETLNHMIDEANSGKTIFYDFYTERQKRENCAREHTSLFFFRGEPGAPFAVVCPGGGFSYVGSLHEGFPLALKISKKGYNAFVIRYRIGGEQIACEDLAAALSYIFRNTQSLEVSTDNYSLWGGSAGARMAADVSSNGTAAYGGDNFSKPGVVVMQYTGHSYYTQMIHQLLRLPVSMMVSQIRR
ncbi:MAG: hypothetical protein LBK00_06235 [Treponema sp.]|jgi:hypothetical protein|nr:hypothetical protein [Treponema sp.]